MVKSPLSRKKPVFNRPGGPQCPTCLRRFSDARWLRNHIARIHNPNKTNDHPCDQCGKRFSEKGNLKRHVRTVHDKVRAFKCGQCGRSFGENRTLQSHIRMVHEGVRSAPCFHCGRTFSNDGNLLVHTDRVHFRIVRNPRYCQLCDFIGQSPSELRRHHIARHTPFRFQCAFGCSNCYSRADHLGGRHLKKLHEITRNYIKYALAKNAHTPPLPDNASQPIKCRYCDMRFPDKKFLIAHLQFRHT